MCTIISKNYVAFARTLVESFLQHHPGGKAYVLLADDPEGLPGSRQELFEWVDLGEIGLPDAPSLKFKYNVTEFNTAVKPFFLDYLLRVRGHDKMVYFDPDILVLRNMDDVYQMLDDTAVILTPHILSPLPDDGKRPEEIDLLKAGVYNLGFLAISRSAASDRLLGWWKERLRHYCWLEPDRGFHVDQKWMDFAPAMFDGVYVSRDSALNAAYWNVHERKITYRDGVFHVNGKPLTFYHFSGFMPDLSGISRHQNRFGWSETADLYHLFRVYAAKLEKHGLAETSGYRYAYGRFDNGSKIPDVVRMLYRAAGPEASRFGDPFRTTDPGGFYRWLLAPLDGDGSIPRLLHEIYLRRGDLRSLFPDPLGANRRALLEWGRQYAPAEYGIDAADWNAAIDRAVADGAVAEPMPSRPARHTGIGRQGGVRGPAGRGRRRRHRPIVRSRAAKRASGRRSRRRHG
ncbi:hypothetical protein DLM86_21810 [Paenibacillus flagellatus]|uniref:Glycosyl transferase n=2 Tax=Paenibacillus flagellatus TaxID=2211139 RepID=A0A2V5KDV1_9BACL|nr:hypothetical protein DLM86_21810 [Paenibacillus flagellatus]